MKRHEIAAVSVAEVWDLRDTFFPSLTRSEREVFERLPVEKRRREWLAGRIAAKRALQRRLGLPFPQIEIRVEESGRPRIFVQERPSDLFLSITHSHDVAAAVAARTPIGFDLERVEPRDPSFESLVLTDRDRARLEGVTGAARDEQLTLLWCEKEAYAKLKGDGLRIPFQELVLPDEVRVDRGTLELGGVPFAWALVLASAPWPTTSAHVAKDP